MKHTSLAELETLAADHKLDGRFREALVLRQELERLYMTERFDATTQAANLNYMAFLAVCVGDLEEAERTARRTVDLYKGVSDPSCEKMATYLSMLSMVLAERGSFEEAVAFGEQAISLYSMNHSDSDGYVGLVNADIKCMRRRERRVYLDRGG